MFEGIKNWFSNSGTLMLSASTMVAGALAAGAAAAGQANLIDTAFTSGFNWKVVAAAGITAFVQGATTYVTRLSGTKAVEVNGKPILVPAIPPKAEVVAVDKPVVVVKSAPRKAKVIK